MSNKSKQNRRNGGRPNNLHLMTREQRAAFEKYRKDLKHVAPQLREMAEAAQAVYRKMIEAPTLQIVDGDPPFGEGETPSVPTDLWNIGGPEVNYVDHIEPIGKVSNTGHVDTERNGS